MQMKWSNYILNWVKWLCITLNSHILLFHSHSGIMQVPICSHLFPWVPEKIQISNFFLFLSPSFFCPFPYPLPIPFPFFLAIDNTKVFFFFSWRLFKHKPSLWENTNCKIRRKKKRLASEHLIIQQLKPVTGLKNSFLSLPSLHIYWGPSSYQMLNECFP